MRDERAGRASRPASSATDRRPGTAAPSAGRQGGARSAPPSGRRDEIDQRTYDPRREERRQAARVALPDDVDPRQLDSDVRAELRSLSRETADGVASHLVMTARLLDDDPSAALAHARAARALAGRVGVVREACGLAAYAAGEWTDALSELRAARRITGQPSHLAVMADCERALDRPARALSYGDDADVSRLDQADRVELVIVLAGARRDLGQAGAAVLLLQDPARRTSAARPWAARLWYAYADALLGAGREDEARDWFSRAAEVDEAGETDAAERLLELEGVSFEDLDESDEDDVPFEPVDLAELVQGVTGPARSAPDPAVEPVPDVDGVETPVEDGVGAESVGAPAVTPAATANPFSGTVEEVSAPSAVGEAVPTVTFQPAPDEDDGETRLFD